jgi:hypothetical protein
MNKVTQQDKWTKCSECEGQETLFF